MTNSTTSGDYLLALGVVCTEHHSDRRSWLRRLYGSSGLAVLVRFVVDAAWLSRQPPASLSGDELGVPMRLAGSGHCVDKSFGWWRSARAFSARYYAKTDDDAVIDLPEMLALLMTLPPARLMAGPTWYTTLNLTTLKPSSPKCTSMFLARALELKREHCPSDFGPYPFVAGPFEVCGECG
jgi:hypothetical protein